MNTDHEIYIPRHAPQKALMLAFGLLITAAGLTQFAPDLWLVLTGTRTEAHAISIIKEKPGIPDTIVHDDAEAEKLREKFDRSYRFWNVFSFTDAHGVAHEVRMPSPAVLKPAFPVTDSGGLPLALPVVYDSAKPDRVVFPSVFSTWVFPVLLTAIGLITSLAALLLLLASRKPIEMPILHNHDE